MGLLRVHPRPAGRGTAPSWRTAASPLRRALACAARGIPGPLHDQRRRQRDPRPRRRSPARYLSPLNHAMPGRDLKWRWQLRLRASCGCQSPYHSGGPATSEACGPAPGERTAGTGSRSVRGGPADPKPSGSHLLIGVIAMAGGQQITKASGYTHRWFCPDAVHHMYVHTAMHRPIVTHPDTRRDKKETARRAAFPQTRGRFRWWWQVLGSNQRRLSRRFYRPLLPTHHIASELRKCCRMTSAAPTLSAICPCTLAPGRRIARTATDTVRRTRLTCQDTQGHPPWRRRRRLSQTSTRKPATCHGRTPCPDFAGYPPQRQRLIGYSRCVRSPKQGRMRSRKSRT